MRLKLHKLGLQRRAELAAAANVAGQGPTQYPARFVRLANGRESSGGLF